MARKFNLTRDFYIPRNSVKVTQKDGDGVVYLYETDLKKFAVCAFYGTRTVKPTFDDVYNTPAQREKKIKEFFEARKNAATRKNGSSSTERTLTVGDILSASWGYDQTNVDFYQVVKLVGKSSVVIQRVKQTIVENISWASERVVPEKNVFVGEPMTRRVRGTAIKIDSVRYAFLWDGKPCYQSHTH